MSRLLIKCLAGIVGSVASLVLYGWIFRIPWLLAPNPHTLPMQFNSAICFLALTIALWELQSNNTYRFTRIAALFITTVGAVTTTEYLFEINLGLDTAFINPFFTYPGQPPGRMGENTAITFTLIGLAVLPLTYSYRERAHLVAALLLFGAFALSGVALVGHFTKAEGIYGWRDLTHMALPTAFCMLAVVIAILLTIVDRHRSNPVASNFWLIRCTYGIGLTTSILLAFATYSLLSAALRQDVRNSARLVTFALQKTLASDILLIRSVERFFAGSSYVSREEFHEFVSPLLNSDSSLISIDWAPRVSGDDRKKTELELSKYGVESLRALDIDRNLIPHPGADVYYPVVYSEPKTIGQKVLGFDHWSDLLRRKAMITAVYRHEPTATETFRLFRLGTGNEDNEDFLGIIPLMADEAESRSFHPSEVQNVRGFIVGVYRFSRLLKTALRGFTEGDFLVSTNFGDPRNYIGDVSPLSVEDRLTVLNRVWSITITPTERYLAPRRSSLPWMVFLMSVSLTVLTGQFLIAQARRREELVNSNRNLMSISQELNNTIGELESYRNALNQHAIVAITDRAGRIVESNSMFSLISGYSSDELLGKTHRIVNSGFHPRGFFVDLWRAISSGQTWRGQIRNRRKSGELYWVDTTIVPVRDGEGKIRRYISLRTDITELKKIQEDLEAARDEARSSTIAKTRFLMNMSHEIRTPLTSIIGYSESLIADALNERERTQAIQSVLRNGKHLLGILNDILDLSKIEAGKMEIEELESSLPDLLTDVRNLLAHHAAEKGITLQIETHFPLPRTIRTDPTRFKQIIINLAGNAIKFTQKGGVTIAVSFDQQSKILTTAVRDTGIGLTEEQCARLFLAFSQADSSTSRKFGGTGLGLVISADLAARLGGEVTVQSEVGVGSIFTVTIACGEISVSSLVTEESDWICHHDERTQPLPQGPLEGSILLAEDGLDNQEYISFILTKAGLDVTVCENGFLAVQAALSRHFDLVLMDMQMPIMDGYTASQTLRDQGYVQPIVALTANIMESDIARCISAGCNDFIGKPFERTNFLRTIYRYLGPKGERPADSIEVDTNSAEQLLEDDPDLLEIMLRFIDNLSTRLTEIETAVMAKDFEALAMYAHRMKGAASNFGFGQLGSVAGVLEKAAERKDHDEVENLLERVRREVARAVSKRRLLESFGQGTSPTTSTTS